MKLASLRTTARTMRAAPAVLTSSGLRARVIKDRFSASVDHAGVVSDARRSDRQRLMSKSDGIGWTEADRVDGLRAAIRVGLRAAHAPGCIPPGSSIAADTLFRCEDGTVLANSPSDPSHRPAPHPQTQTFLLSATKIDSGEAAPPVPEGTHAAGFERTRKARSLRQPWRRL